MDKVIHTQADSERKGMEVKQSGTIKREYILNDEQNIPWCLSLTFFCRWSIKSILSGPVGS